MNIIECFPDKLKNILYNELNLHKSVEEIRIRIELPVILKASDKEVILEYIIKRDDINEIIRNICENSLYSYQEEISNGYITINGGHRVGIVGSSVIENNKIINLNYISGLNFRISRQILNCSDSIIEDIINRENDNIYNTLIVSPPGLGKTTILRDLVRKISNGIDKFKGINVTVIDERGEIGACYKGVCQNDLGIRTDVLNDTPKSIGMRMAVRSMSPKVIVADEIGCKEDSEAIKYAVCCGVKGIFTAHGSNMEDLRSNPTLNDLIKSKVFERIIFIKSRMKGNIDKEILRREYDYSSKINLSKGI